MNITLPIKDLKVALGRSKLALTKRNGGGPLPNVLVTAKGRGHGEGELGSSVTLTTTNGDLFAVIPVRGNVFVEEHGTILLSFQDLADIAATTRVTKARIQTKEDDHADLVAGSLNLCVPTYKLEDSPHLPEFTGTEIKLSTLALREALQATATETMRPVLHSVCLDKDAIVATDSYRLYILETPCPVKKEVLLQREFVAAITATDDDVQLTIQPKAKDYDTAYVRAEVNGEVWVGRQETGAFPPYKQLVPSETSMWVTFNAEEFIKAARNQERIVRDSTAPLMIAERQGGLTVSNYASAWTSRVLTQEIGGTMGIVGSKVAFNPHFIRELVTGLEGAEATLRGTDALKPWLLTEQTPFGLRKRLIMPVRIA